MLWPPNHKLRSVELSGASDPDGETTTLEVTGVTQDEPAGGQPDAFVREGGALLRAERDGRGDGRTYSISFEVSDGSDSCSGTAAVSVPQERR